MTVLTQQDLQGILKCLQELHVACNLEELPTRAIAALSQVVSSDFNILVSNKFSLPQSLIECNVTPSCS